MKTSKNGVQFIAKHEGFVPYWYDDLNPSKEWNGGEVKGTLTIGFGHTSSVPVQGQRITKEQGLELLAKDIKTAENIINKAIKRPINQNQFDALVSFAFNTGRSKTTLYDLVNAKKKTELIDFWVNHYITSKGKLLKGLVNRRKEEAMLYFNDRKINLFNIPEWLKKLLSLQ